jgi:hypothetical protein
MQKSMKTATTRKIDNNSASNSAALATIKLLDGEPKRLEKQYADNYDIELDGLDKIATHVLANEINLILAHLGSHCADNYNSN